MSLLSKRPAINRLNLVIFAVCAAFFLLILRLFFLQVLNYEKYKTASLNQRENFFKESSLRRGDIFLTGINGDYSPAVSTKKGFLTYINARTLEGPEEAYAKLSQVIEIDKEKFFKFSQKNKDPFEILKRKLSPEDAEFVLSLGLKGVGITEDEWRFYPREAFLSHVLGFSSVISDIPEGRYGIEKFYNSI